MGGTGRNWLGRMVAVLVLAGGLMAGAAADINADGQVNLLDYAQISANWGQAGALAEDLSGDGQVGPEDLAIFTERWGQLGQGPVPGELESGPAEMAKVEVYASGNQSSVFSPQSSEWGEIVKTAQCRGESYTLEVNDPDPFWGEKPLEEFHNYYVCVSRPGFYSKIAQYNQGEAVETALEPVVAGKTNGVIYLCQGAFAPLILAETAIEVRDGAGRDVLSFQTDGQGRYAADLPAGEYQFVFRDYFGSDYAEPVMIAGEYQDLGFAEKLVQNN